MKRFTPALFAALTGCVLLSPIATRAEDAAKIQATAHAKYQAVLQVSDADPKKWNLALTNLRYVQQALGKDNIDLKLVVYGPGIAMLKLNSEESGKVNNAIKAGVQVLACENSMKSQNIPKSDMMPTISYVPAGVAEIIKLQQAGYAYIHP